MASENRPSGQSLAVYKENLSTELVAACDGLSDSSKQKMVEAYKKNPKNFNVERALLCNVENWAVYCQASNIVNIEDALNPIIPPLSSFKKYAPREKLVEFLEVIFIRTVLDINVKKNLNSRQIRSAIETLLESDIYYYFTLNEIIYVMLRGRAGIYNPDGFFASMSISNIFAWFDKYDEERTEFIERKKHNEHIEKKNADLKIGSYSKEWINKIKEVLKKMAGKDKPKFIPKSEKQISKEREKQIFNLKNVFPNELEKSKNSHNRNS